jgi:hypothetical protein
MADELFAKYIAKRPVDEILAFKDDFNENLNPVSDDSNTVGNTVQC